mmetsp:Transcript_83475/g.232371  ORF Transcript_83475/g.232371 Transcript_83475/m.232371 type:complete len:82 (-) Transcript_83475:918-1163(-)
MTRPTRCMSERARDKPHAPLHRRSHDQAGPLTGRSGQRRGPHTTNSWLLRLAAMRRFAKKKSRAFVAKPSPSTADVVACAA